MSNPTPAGNRTEAARAFVEHLRRHPAEADGDPAVLAERFGLDTEFVRRALSRRPDPDRSLGGKKPHALIQRAGGTLALLDRALERAAQSPVRFEALSMLAAFVAILALSALLPKEHVEPGQVQWSLRLALILATFAVTVLLQFSVFYRRRMARYALYGGLVFWVGTALPLMVTFWLRLRGQPELGRGVQVFTIGIAMGLVGVVYGGLAALASVAGGWAHLRRAEREWEQLSRQELLERYFELQRRLERSVAAEEGRQSWEDLSVVTAVRKRPFAAAAAVGLGTGLLHVALHAGFGTLASANSTSDVLDVLLWVKSLMSYTLFIVVAFLSGRTNRGALCGPAAMGGFLLANLIPASGFGPGYLLGSIALLWSGFDLIAYTGVGAVAGLGATIQRRAAHEQQLQRNDGATLVAEMLEIQRRLEEDATSVTVLVVDAAKSTSMKVGADPLDVEYSFREYQAWIGECCVEFGGRIHSLAGDGAVVAFANGAAAVAAARRMQTGVVRFNAEANRLPKPFRLRLGLHAGRVAGDLNDVQFTEVIDIAAHVESISPVGGIAVTGMVIAQIGEEGFLPLSRDVDGQTVYIALVPTEA